MARLKGDRSTISFDEDGYPEAFRRLRKPPRTLFCIGSRDALQEGLAVVGSRKCTPYGHSCAEHFATLAAERGIVIISGGARGCDSVAHEAALKVEGKTVAFLGGGCDKVYPAENTRLFQRIIDSGGAVVSEQEWDTEPRGFMFRERNRLIAGLARATLIVEAGLPSGTFSTADEAIAADREVLAIPGSITSKFSSGTNRLIYQGATPIVDDDVFADQLFSLFGCLKQEGHSGASRSGEDAVLPREGRFILEALNASNMTLEELAALSKQKMRVENPLSWLMVYLTKGIKAGILSQYPDGRYGTVLKGS